MVVVEPSRSVCRVLSGVKGKEIDPKAWVKSTALRLHSLTDRPIVCKEKGGGFLGEIANAHAVVSLSSVAEVEAALNGVPVFVTEDSPAWPVNAGGLEDIEHPARPDREDWIRTLSYSQFNVDEMSSGKAWGILKELYGDHDI